MKVLFIAPGNDIHAIRWIDRISEQGIDCILLNSIPNHELIPTRARVLNIEDSLFLPESRLASSPWASYKRYRNFRRAIVKVIEEENPDLLHLHWLFDLPQLAGAKISKKPVVATPYGSDLLLYSRPKIKTFHKFLVNHLVTKTIIKNSDYFCCDALHLQLRLTRLSAPADRVEIIYFGTDIEVFSPNLRTKNYREELNIPKDHVVVLSNRGLSEIYDVKTFIMAASHVLRTKPDITFVVAGGGPLLEELKALSNQLGIASHVKFLGRLNDEEFNLATGNADIYVSTSTSDGGLAASVAEAMACEKPVIISEFGDNSDWLENGSAGLSFQIGNHLELASQIIKLASNEDLRVSMGKSGREIISRRNNSRVEVSKILKLYEKATSLDSA